jgi:hypothetical protein
VSNLLGAAAQMGSAMIRASDESVAPKYHAWNARETRIQIDVWSPGVTWQGSRFTGGGGGWGGPILDDLSGNLACWDTDLLLTGGQQAKKFIGTTRDSTGTALGSCVVRAFVTSTGTFIGQVTSDTAGYFELPSSAGAIAHYLVAYKSAGPDIAGTTVNTLIPV